jgi:ribose/xylose/arabinose/galactoside ABC-type transport system permease subunit
MTTTEPAAVAASPRAPLLGWLSRLGPALGLIAVVVLFSILTPSAFLSVYNFETIVRQSAVVIVAALGMTMIIISGGIDLSVGSTVALCSVIVALLLRDGHPPMVAVAGGVAGGSAVGLIIGLLVTRVRISPFIATLGLWGALRGLAERVAGKGNVTPDEVHWLASLLTPARGHRSWMILPPGVWLTLLLAMLVAAMLRYTQFGRHVFAVGSNEQTARLCGVNVPRTKVLVYVLAAALTGVAGVLQFAYMAAGDPTTAPGLELDVIAAVVIGGASLSGGTGSIFGTICGALLMKVVANGCTALDWENSEQKMITGGIIIAAAALDRLRHRRR